MPESIVVMFYIGAAIVLGAICLILLAERKVARHSRRPAHQNTIDIQIRRNTHLVH